MTPEKQKLLDELLSGAADTGIKGKLTAFDPSKPYGSRFQVEGSYSTYTDGEVAFDNFQLGQQVQVFQGGGAVQWIFSSNKLIDKAKLKQSQKQTRRLASQKKPKNPTVVKGYDPKKGYLVTEGSSEYPNCKSITNGAIAIGATVIRKGNLIDQMRVRPGKPDVFTSQSNKIKYLYTGPVTDKIQCLYAAGWKPNLSIKIREFKDGWSLASALIDNLGGDRFLCSLVATRQKSANQQEFLCEYYDGSTLQWSVSTPFAPAPYGYGFFTGKDQEQVCKVAEGQVSLLPYENIALSNLSSATVNATKQTLAQVNSREVNASTNYGASFTVLQTETTGETTGLSVSAVSMRFLSFLSPEKQIANKASSQSTSQSSSKGFDESHPIGFFNYYPFFVINESGTFLSFGKAGSTSKSQRLSGSSSSSSGSAQETQPNRWNGQLETYLATSSESDSSSNSGTQSGSLVETIFLSGTPDFAQTTTSSSGPTTTEDSSFTSKFAYLRNEAETDPETLTNQFAKVKTVEDSADIKIVGGSLTADQYFYSSAFPANSTLISAEGSKAESSTKALLGTKDQGTEAEQSATLSWAYLPVTANTDILKEGLAQIQGSAYTNATITHEYEESGVPKTQKVAKLAKETIEIIVPLYDKAFLYQGITKARVLPPEIATITTDKGAIAFGFLNGSYSP